jgi:Putative Flp pilus-assembly TadE/G-like
MYQRDCHRPQPELKMMRRYPANSARNGEQGIIITLVAVFMLAVVGAMAALAIDVVTFYAARSEAQLAADGAALAGARVLANSGMTSDAGLAASAASQCQTTANQVAISNLVGGQTPTVVTDTCNFGNVNNPTVTIKVQATLPTFFARIWGTRQVTVSASATAEAYNPEGLGAGSFPVAPSCVKPLLLQNADPTNGGNPIFNSTSGLITPASNLLGSQQTLLSTGGAGAWQYLAGDTFSGTPSFPPPPAASVTSSVAACSGTSLNTFQLAVAGCVQIPITCNNNTTINTVTAAAYTAQYGTTVDPDTQAAVNCLSHSTSSNGDRVFGYPTSNPPTAPFEFVSGDDNPIVQAGALTSGKEILISDSLVTLPVYAVPATTPLTLVGFVQLFLNPDGNAAPTTGPPSGILVTVVNLVGCGTNATGTPPIYGNGPSPVAVRLITPSS